MESQICWIFGTTWPCLTPSEWAAWAQALATALGLAIAIYIPTRQRRETLQDRQREEIVLRRATARSLRPELSHLHTRSKVSADMANSDIYRSTRIEPLDDLPALKSLRDRMHLFGGEEHVFADIEGMTRYANMTIGLANMEIDHNGRIPDQLRSYLASDLSQLSEMAARGLAVIDELLSSEKVS